MKIVIDTNFIIAAFISHGYCYELFEYFINSNHKLYTSDWILKEVKEKLLKKFKYSFSETTSVIDLLKLTTDVMFDIPFIEKAICRDSDDDNIIGLALLVKADCIITGDKDLLVLT